MHHERFNRSTSWLTREFGELRSQSCIQRLTLHVIQEGFGLPAELADQTWRFMSGAARCARHDTGRLSICGAGAPVIWLISSAAAD